MLMVENVDEIVDLVCEEEVVVVIIGVGSFGKFMEKWKKYNIKVILVVVLVVFVKRMEKVGVDVIIVEGIELGGYVG